MRYPLGEYEKDQITSKTGKKVDDLTLDEVLKDNVTADDIKEFPKEMLGKQGQVCMENDNPAMFTQISRERLNLWMCRMM